MIIETKIIEKPAFTVVGITEAIQFDSSVPPSENAIAKLWGRFGKRIPEIQGEIGFRSFGLILGNPKSPYEYDGGTCTGKYEFEFYDQRYTKLDAPNAEIDLYFPIRDK